MKVKIMEGTTNVEKKEVYGVPALLSLFIPGLGQIVKGQVAKGILIMIASFVAVLLCLVLIGFVLYPIIWIWSIYDAYQDN